MYNNTQTYNEQELQQIKNYWKLIGFDSQLYREEAKRVGVQPSKSLLTEAKAIDGTMQWSSNKDVDGDILDLPIQSLQYENGLNLMMFWYESDVQYNKTTKHRGKAQQTPVKQLYTLLAFDYTKDGYRILKARDYFKNLDKPLSWYLTSRDIAKYNIRQQADNRTDGKKRESNPFIGQYTLSQNFSPLDVIESRFIANDMLIDSKLEQLKDLQTKYRATKASSYKKQIDKVKQDLAIYAN